MTGPRSHAPFWQPPKLSACLRALSTTRGMPHALRLHTCLPLLQTRSDDPRRTRHCWPGHESLHRANNSKISPRYNFEEVSVGAIDLANPRAEGLWRTPPSQGGDHLRRPQRGGALVHRLSSRCARDMSDGAQSGGARAHVRKLTMQRAQTRIRIRMETMGMTAQPASLMPCLDANPVQADTDERCRLCDVPSARGRRRPDHPLPAGTQTGCR
jgi:hypothetical protein